VSAWLVTDRAFYPLGTNSTWLLAIVSLSGTTVMLIAVTDAPLLRCSIRHPLQDERVVGRSPRSSSDDFCYLTEPGSAPASAKVGLGTGRVLARDFSPALVASPRGCSRGFFGPRQRRVRPDPAFSGRVSLDPRRRLDGLFPARIGRARGTEGAAVADLEAVQSLELCDQGGRRSWLVAELVLRSGEQDGGRGFCFFIVDDWNRPPSDGRRDDGAEYTGHSDRPHFEYKRLERFRPIPDDLDKSDFKFDLVGAPRSSLCGVGGRGRGF
jgi:hypothetical protein